MKIDVNKTYTATIETTAGTITATLYPKDAPNHVNSFVFLAREGFYDGVIFHRVIPGFMIQGGGFTAAMQQKPTKAPIVNESTNGLSNARGTVAMARTSDPDSATAQFFINLVDNRNLDSRGGAPGYAVFGKVIEGMGVVDKIASVPTGSAAGMQDVPREPITIVKATVHEAGK
jgi:cyclophilin family peptidyl-prolyl cis-trans isomerase